MSYVAIYLLQLAIHFTKINAEVISCDGQNACDGQTIYCASSEPCTINCLARESCKNTQLDGSLATDVTMACNGDYACPNANIMCGAAVCKLNCDKDATDSCKDVIFNINQATSYSCAGGSACTTVTYVTLLPTRAPSHSASYEPSAEPSPSPVIGTTNTPEPTRSPIPTTAEPSPSPSIHPTRSPANNPTFGTNAPTPTPTPGPTRSPQPSLPTPSPTRAPTDNKPTAPTVTASPTPTPTTDPTIDPTPDPVTPTINLSLPPTPSPVPTIALPTTPQPTPSPTRAPTPRPTFAGQTFDPTESPTSGPPTNYPTPYPSPGPTQRPSRSPTQFGDTLAPTNTLTLNPTHATTHSPTLIITVPSPGPTDSPTKILSLTPTIPTDEPTPAPTPGPISPTARPTYGPTKPGETRDPTIYPSPAPTKGTTTRSPTGTGETLKPTIAVQTTHAPTPGPTLVPTVVASPTPSPTERWEKCIDDITIFDVIGNTVKVSISIEIERLSEQMKIIFVGPIDRWFAIGFNNTEMNNTYAIVINLGTNGLINAQQRILGYHNNGKDVDNGNGFGQNFEVNGFDIQGKRNAILKRRWKMFGFNAFDFTEWLNGNICELQIIWGYGNDNSFQKHMGKGTFSLWSCFCTRPPTETPAVMPTTERPTQPPTLKTKGDNTGSANYIGLSLGIFTVGMVFVIWM